MSIPQKHCASCGNLFSRDNRCTWAHWDRVRFCSRKCVGRERTRKADENRAGMLEVFSRWFETSNGCWIWNGAVDKDGYGIFSYAGKTYRAAKIALELDGRPVPKGLYACHHCDNPTCVRNEHLYPGTPKQNVDDMMSRGRAKHAKKLTPTEVIAIRGMRGTHDDIAALFGVSRSNVSQIKEGKIWRNVP